MQLRQVMSHEVQNIGPEATLKEAAQKMQSMDIGVLPVCENDRIVGMITDRDIAVRAVAAGKDPNSAKVRTAMTSDLCFCYEDEEVQKAAKLMMEKQIRRLPVFDRDQRLCGIVSLGDIATRTRDEQLSGGVLQEVSEPNMPHA